MQRQHVFFSDAVSRLLAVGLLVGFAGCGAVPNQPGASDALSDASSANAGSDAAALPSDGLPNDGLGEESFDLGDLDPSDVRRVFVAVEASAFDVAGLGEPIIGQVANGQTPDLQANERRSILREDELSGTFSVDAPETRQEAVGSADTAPPASPTSAQGAAPLDNASGDSAGGTGRCCLPDGGCRVLDPATCSDLGSCTNGSDCSVANQDCGDASECVTAGGNFNTPGGNCDPNCCEQPVETGGDCCADKLLCENGGSALEDEDCVSDADCDQNRGRCADDSICAIDLQDCVDNSLCQGPNNCSLCQGAVTVDLDVPSFLLAPNDPARTWRFDVSGTTTNTAFGRAEGDTCTLDNTDDGWYEKFSFQGHCEIDFLNGTGGADCSLDRDCNLEAGELCIGGCAVVTLNVCCTTPLMSPIFIGLTDVTDTCICDEFTDFVTVDRNAAGVAKRGFGLACNHDDVTDPEAQPCCEDGNYSMQYSLLSGTWTYQLVAGKFCQNSVTECATAEDCVGVPCTTEGQDYQLHYTVTPCRRAACCLNIPCTTDADCDAVYTSTCNTDNGFCNSSCLQTTKLECEGFALNGIIPDIPGDWLGDLEQPIAECSLDGTPENNVCRIGACCTGPGSCDDTILTTLDVCLADNPDNIYHGGITCDQAGRPCGPGPATDVMQRKVQDAIEALTTPIPEEKLVLAAVDQAIETLFTSNLWLLPTPGDETGGVCSQSGEPCDINFDCTLPGEVCLPADDPATAARALLDEVIAAFDTHIQDPTLGTPNTKEAAWDARNFLLLFQEAQQVIGDQTGLCDPTDLRNPACLNLLAGDEGGTDVDLVFPGFSRQVRSPFWIGASTTGIIQEQVIVPGVIAPGECSFVLKEIQGVKAIVRRYLIPIWVEPWFARARIVGFRIVWVWEFVPAEFLKTITYCNVQGFVVQDVEIRVVIERALLHFWSYLNKDITLSP